MNIKQPILKCGWSAILMLFFCLFANATIDITHLNATSPGHCSGSIGIMAEGTAGPFTLQLTQTADNGTHSLLDDASGVNGGFTFSGLCAGDYTIEVTNAFGCVTLLNTSIIACEGLTLPGGNTCPKLTHPTSCGSIDGGIRFIGCVAEGGVGPYNYLWSTGESTRDISGLAAGAYSLTITDANGCKGFFNYTLEGQNEPFVYSDQGAACEGEANGHLSVWVEVNGDPANCNYTFEWSTGEILTENCISDLLSIPTGTYTVTITDVTGECVNTQTYQINEIPDQGPFEIGNAQTITSCADQATGQIITQPQGGNPPYLSAWSNGMTGSTLTQLPAGTYTLTLTDYCDRQIIQPYTIDSYTSIQITENSISGCPGTGLIDIAVSGGTPPYTYQWSDGQSESNASDLDNGGYELTVSDANGCTSTSNHVVQLGEVTIVDQEDVCEDLHNGVVTIEIIKKFDNAAITIIHNGLAEIPVSSTENPVSITIEGLSPSETNTIDVTVADCFFDFSFVLNPLEKTKEYDRLINDRTCVFNEVCDGEVLGEVEEAATYDYLSAAGAGFGDKCELPIFCGSDVVKTVKLKKKKVRGGRYLIILDAAVRAGLISLGDEERLRNDFHEVREIGFCENVRYCPSSFEIVSNSKPFLFLSGGGSFGPVNPETGCQSVDCNVGLLNYTVCPNTINVLGLNSVNFTNSLFDCQPISMNVRLLNHYWENGQGPLINEFPDFADTEMETFLMNHGDRPEAACGTVTFCSKNFTYISDDLDLIICGALVAGSNPGVVHTCDVLPLYYQGERVGEQVFCNRFSSVPVTTSSNIIDYTKDVGDIIRPFSASAEESLDFKYHIDTFETETLTNFALIKDQNSISPKGLLESEGECKFLDYDHKSYLSKKINYSKTVEFFIDDWDAEQSVMIYSLDNNQGYSAAYEDTLKEWTYPLQSDGFLKLKHLSKEGESIYVGGVFINELFYDSSMINRVSTPTAFLLKLNLDGSIIDQHYIENVDVNQEVRFSENRNQEIFVSGKFNDNWMALNGVLTTFGKTDGWFIAKIDANNSLQIATVFYGIGDYDLLDLSLSEDNQAISLALYGNGTLEMDDNMIFSTSLDQLVLLSIDEEQGQLNWVQALEGSNIDPLKFDMTFGSGHELIIGISFEDSILIQTGVLASNGLEDIAILKWSNQGQMIWTRTYGTMHHENVSKLFYDNEVIYFGGEYAGNNDFRKIGNYAFFDVWDTTQTAYLSYVYDGSPNVENRNNLEDIGLKNKKQSLQIYPNPFKKTLQIQPQGIQSGRIEMINSLGQIIYTERIENDEEIMIDLGAKSSGILFIKAFNEKGELITVEKVIKSN